ncbi:MAG: LPS assembly protein LptD [Gammaproteobacteria bacterium]|nr:LPS assembly protein LptD [Gammaproteobacteria bacterium]
MAKANLSMLQIWNKQYLRDLQARMYYLYIPWRDQSAYPNFDTGYISSNQDFYFMDNRFKGIDRIGDANQIAIGMRSGFVEPNSGRLLADFGVNEMLALRKHRVCLLDSCLDDVNAFHHLSPMLLYASYHPVNALELGARARLNLPKKHVSHLDVSMGYGKDNEHAMVYFGLRRVANLSAIYYPISVVGSHIDWQLSSHWSMSSDLRYQKRPQSRLAYDIDLNYDSCCWAASLKLIQTDRSFTKLIRKYYRPDIRLSIQLKGLGSIASH